MSNGFTRCIWHTRPAYSYNKQSEQNQTETRWRQDGKVFRSTALTYDWPLSCPAKTAAEWGTRRHFLFFRQAWRKCERRGLRKKKSAKKMYKKGKKNCGRSASHTDSECWSRLQPACHGIPGVQLVKRSAILNGVIMAVEWKSEGGFATICILRVMVTVALLSGLFW